MSLIENLLQRFHTSDDGQKDSINQVLEQAIDAVISIDEHNIVTFFNDAAERLWGYQRQEVIGQNVAMMR